jgi:hypothetical protein
LGVSWAIALIDKVMAAKSNSSIAVFMHAPGRESRLTPPFLKR